MNVISWYEIDKHGTLSDISTRPHWKKYQNGESMSSTIRNLRQIFDRNNQLWKD